MKDYERYCHYESCGKKFLTFNPHAKYCSKSCKSKAFYETKTKPKRAEEMAELGLLEKDWVSPKSKNKVEIYCLGPNCSKPINRDLKHGHKPRKYCSDGCRQSAFHVKHGKHEYHQYDGRCAECNVYFQKSRLGQKYCSKECGQYFHNKKNKEKKLELELKRSKRKVTKKNLICHYCGDNYEAVRSTSMFCNSGCRTSFGKQHRFKHKVHINERYEEYLPFDDAINRIFINCEFIEVNMGDMNLTQARFINCLFNDADFDRSILDAVRFINCHYKGGVTMDGAWINFTQFEEGLIKALVHDISACHKSSRHVSQLWNEIRKLIDDNNKRID